MEDLIKKIDKDLPEYWDGNSNLLIRLYVYLQMGFAESNNAKVIVAGIWGLYLLLKLTNPWWILIFALVMVPILIVVGRFKLYRVSKIGEYVQTVKGSVLGYNGYNIQIRTLELLEKMESHLNELNNKNK